MVQNNRLNLNQSKIQSTMHCFCQEPKFRKEKNHGKQQLVGVGKEKSSMRHSYWMHLLRGENHRSDSDSRKRI